jgi:tRNA 2-thiouridine synthesizing protein E
VLSEELKVSLSEELGREHWRIINRLREHHIEQGKPPVAKQIRHKLDVEVVCVGRCFGDPRGAWRRAGLPDPGEEARAYIETAKQPSRAD